MFLTGKSLLSGSSELAGLQQVCVDQRHSALKRQHMVIIGTTELLLSRAARRPTAVLLKRWKILQPRLKNLQHITNGNVSGLDIIPWMITIVILYGLLLEVICIDCLIQPLVNPVGWELSSFYNWGHRGQQKFKNLPSESQSQVFNLDSLATS